MNNNRLIKSIALVIVLAMVFSLVGCSTAPNPSLPDSDHLQIENVQTEQIIVESTEIENIYYEHITTEIYQEELILAEQTITELLLEEETIEEVVLCQTVYVSQDNIEDFAQNSQTAALFGDDIDLSALLTKIAIGTGVIVTLVVLTKVGIPNQMISSIIVAAADESLQFGATGAALGSLFGASTGAADEIDKSGRTSAVIGFAVAVAGLVISIVSLIAAVPSGGSSSITLAAGIKLVIAGIGTAAAAIGTGYAAYNAVKTFTSTDVEDIDWNNVDWEAAGVTAAERAINYGADGYMWGAIIGAVHGGADGYEFYVKYSAPYSAYNARLVQTPKDDEFGHWTGERGESDYVYDKPKTIQVGEKTYEIPAGTKVAYNNCVADFSPYQVAQVKIPSMTNNRSTNFSQADEALAQIWTKNQFNGKGWTAADVAAYRKANGLTWHEMNNMEYMQLVPTEINGGFGHFGGVGEYNVMVGQTGGTVFDG